MPSTSIRCSESDVIKLVQEFLENRSLHISLLNVERETGIINGAFSDDMLFLRQLILNGQWDDVLDFIQPLAAVESFNTRKFQYVIHKHKFLELLCIKGESAPMYEEMVEKVVTTLNSLEQLCPTKEDYNNFCLLLTLPKLSDHVEYQSWNPSSARVDCFKEIRPLIEKFLPIDKRDKKSEDRFHTAKDDRMIQLLIKGLLYESCVDYCQHKATSSDEIKDIKISHLLHGTGFSDADLSLLSWLQAIPHDIFTCPFEQKSLNLDMRAMEKPLLEASWSEQILVTPIKPKLFPHSAMPSNSQTDLMSRSLNPQYDGLAFGLNASGRRDPIQPSNLMSRSFAGFHLNNGPKPDLMQTSMDKLFTGAEHIDTQSSLIIENTPPKSRSPRPYTPPAAGSPKVVSRTSTPKQSSGSPVSGSPRHSGGDPAITRSSQELYKEYQKQRELLKEQLEEQEKKRLLYQEQLEMLERQTSQVNENNDDYDNRFIDSGISPGYLKKTYDDVIDEKEQNKTKMDQEKIPNKLPESPSIPQDMIEKLHYLQEQQKRLQQQQLQQQQHQQNQNNAAGYQNHQQMQQQMQQQQQQQNLMYAQQQHNHKAIQQISQHQMLPHSPSSLPSTPLPHTPKAPPNHHPHPHSLPPSTTHSPKHQRRGPTIPMPPNSPAKHAPQPPAATNNNNNTAQHHQQQHHHPLVAENSARSSPSLVMRRTPSTGRGTPRISSGGGGDGEDGSALQTLDVTRTQKQAVSPGGSPRHQASPLLQQQQMRKVGDL